MYFRYTLQDSFSVRKDRVRVLRTVKIVYMFEYSVRARTVAGNFRNY